MASSPKARDTEPPSSLDETGTMEASTVGNTVLVSSIPATISASALVEILSSVAGVVIPQGAAEKKQGDQPSDGGGPPQLQLVQLMQEPSVETTVQEVVQQEEVKSGRKSGNKKDKTGKQPWHYHLGKSTQTVSLTMFSLRWGTPLSCTSLSRAEGSFRSSLRQ